MTREEAKEILTHNWTRVDNPNYSESELDEAFFMAIEALSIVQCKDCRHFKKIVERSDSGLCHRDIVASVWKENGYCSRGERREK